jgi:hypothetical protein
MKGHVLDIDAHEPPAVSSTPRVPARLRTPALFMTQQDVRIALGSAVVWMAAASPSPSPWSTAAAEEQEEETTHVGDDEDDAPKRRADRVIGDPDDDRVDPDEGADIDASGKGGYADIGGWIETTYELDDQDIVEIWDDPEPTAAY